MTVVTAPPTGLLNAPGGPCHCPTCGPATFTPAGLITAGARPTATAEGTITAVQADEWVDARLAMHTIAVEQKAELDAWWRAHRTRTWAALGLTRTGSRP